MFDCTLDEGFKVDGSVFLRQGQVVRLFNLRRIRNLFSFLLFFMERFNPPVPLSPPYGRFLDIAIQSMLPAFENVLSLDVCNPLNGLSSLCPGL